MRTRGVLFDVDDTLFDYTGASRSALSAHLTSLGQPVGHSEQLRWEQVTNLAYRRYLSGEITFAEQRLERARAMAPSALSDAEAAAWIQGFQGHFRANWRLFPDVRPTLDVLAGLVLGVITNSDSVAQTDKLGVLGVVGRFGCVVGVDTAGVAKPDPAIFQAGCHALGLAPAETVYVGDKLEADALGARQAGLLGVLLDRTGSVRPPAGVLVIRTLTELPGLLASLNARPGSGPGDGAAAFTGPGPLR
jgi:putative hydrolase of the HAD superfamily